MQKDLIQSLEQSYQKEIATLSHQLYSEYKKNKERTEEIKVLQDKQIYLRYKIDKLEETIETLSKEKLNAL